MDHCVMCGGKNVISPVNELYSFDAGKIKVALQPIECERCLDCGERFFSSKVTKQIEAIHEILKIGE